MLICKPGCKYKSIVNYSLVLLVFVAQFVSMVHAAEHPFHEDDAACAVFFSIEQNKFLIGDEQNLSLLVAFVVNKKITPINNVWLSVRHHYLQRAPPFSLA